MFFESLSNATNVIFYLNEEAGILISVRPCFRLRSKIMKAASPSIEYSLFDLLIIWNIFLKSWNCNLLLKSQSFSYILNILSKNNISDFFESGQAP